MKKPQVTTTLGTAGMFTQFLSVFNDVKAVNFFEYVAGMTIGEIYLVVAPIALFLWAILHDEDKDVVVL